MTPKRIQRKRTKGWKMPENTVNVTRPGKWGNPFKVVGNMIYVDAKHRRKILDKWVIFEPNTHELDVVFWFKELFEKEMTHTGDSLYWSAHFQNLDLSELRGKNLACFCKEGEPCHADVLLELANK